METINARWEELAVFRAVVQAGSFTAAAAGIGVSKSKLSKQLARLESDLGVELLRRTTRTLTLTEAGRALQSYVNQMHELGKEAGAHLSDLKTGHEGTVRLTAPVSFGESIFPDLIPRLARLLPRVSFEIDLDNSSRDFQRDETDFALRAREVTDPNLVARYLGKMGDVICATPKLARKLAHAEPAALAEHDCILSQLDPAWNQWFLRKGKAEVSVRVKGKLSTNQYGLALRLALKGEGIVRLPAYIAAESVRAGGLVRLFADYEIATHPLYLAYAKDRYLSARNRKVREEILAWFKERTDIFI